VKKGLVLVIILLFSFAGLAQQSGTAVLTGIVRDPVGAVIPGAQLEIKNESTNAVRSTKSSAEGRYTFNELPAGKYSLNVASSGFAGSRTEINLLVGQQTSHDLTLKLGAQSETLTVIETAAAVNVTDSVVDSVIENSTIQSLPLNGRNFLELAFLIPGNSPAPNFDPTKTNTVLVSSAGQLGRGGNVSIDGSDNNDDVVGGALENLPQDAVQEFQIATNRFSAELGRSGSSVINVVTKSGGNSYRGSVSFFDRDAVLQGLPATFDRTLGITPPFGRRQYAGALGGPIVKDKAWFFTGFEYRDQNGAVLVGERDLATKSIKKSFAPAPLTDVLFTSRGDWQPNETNSLSFRYSLDRGEDVGASTLIRAIGSASERQSGINHYQAFSSSWSHLFSSSLINRLSFSENNYINVTSPVQNGPQLTFPSIQDGSSFRVPQQTRQNRLEFSDSLSWVKNKHNLKFGTDVQRIDADFNLGVFQAGRIELVEDFAPFDRNGDGLVNDNDLLFAVTLRSAFPAQALVLPNSDSSHIAFFAQDDWRVHPQFSVNLGLRYELDTDVKNVGRVSQLNPLILPFLKGTRGKDMNNFGPRIGFNWATKGGNLSAHGGYGIYYDRVTLEIQSLERGLDGRALPIEVRGGNVFFLTPTGTFAPGAPTVSNPFTGPIFPGAGAGGINIIDNNLQNPMIQQFNAGVQANVGRQVLVKADYLHNLGTHFIIGRSIGTVFNPVVGGPDVVKNIESSVNTKYDGLLLSVQKRYANRYAFNVSYTLSKAFNYANDDQIPFANGPIDSNNLPREYGPTPNDQRHRFVFSGTADLAWGFKFAPIWTIASGVPMDILLPDASSRVPQFSRNAGGRTFNNAADLNAAITALNASQPVANKLPLVDPNARFSDSFQSFDMRLSKQFKLGERASLEAMGEAFNLFNITNILGVSNVNYSGFNNALVRDDNNSANPGYLRSSTFGKPVTTAGGVFGSGGPRAFQLGLRLAF
jgi:hypothetical protein